MASPMFSRSRASQGSDAQTDTTHVDMLTSTAYDVDTVRAMERPLLEEGTPLMQMAARATAHTVLELLPDLDTDPDDLRVTLLAGAGDNGGDGLFAGAFLASRGIDVTAIAVGKQLHSEAFATFIQAGGHIWTLDPQSHIPGCPTGFSSGEAGQRLAAAIRFAKRSQIIIDAMAGIGVHGALRGIPAALAEALGDYVREDADSKPIVVAVDTPSGIGVNDGALPGAYIPADVTVMFGAMKPCAMLPPAAFACGRVVVVDFGFDLESMTATVESADASFAGSSLREPLPSDSKYSRGVTGLITGSVKYPGAAVLSTMAAARTNIGMVRYLGPQRAQDLVLQSLPEATIGKGRVESWVVGCGVPAAGEGEQDMQRQAIATLLAHYALHSESRAESISNIDGGDVDYADAGNDDEAMQMPPIVVDAGALDLLPKRVPAQVVITPHAIELARLLSRIDQVTSVEQINEQPLHYAQRAAQLTGATVLLKGALTIVVGPDEEGSMTRTLVVGRAPAMLATAGAGDVLAGMLGALLAQQAQTLLDDPASITEVVAGGAYMHGLAAALASQNTHHAWNRPQIYGAEKSDQRTAAGHPIIATDVIEAIPDAFDVLENIDN